jgi:indole-3-glycerol phosphate synthase
LEVNLDTTTKILNGTSKSGNVVISESGIDQPNHIKSLLDSGADGFLIGTSLMENPEAIGKRIQELAISK